MASEPQYPIREVSRLTGINPVTLRAWQRRYGLLKPARTDKGHRLYSDDDIALIRQILHWVEQGVSIGQVKGLLSDPQPVKAGSNWEQALHRLLTAACELNLGRLEVELNELASLYPAELLLRHVIEPWLAELGRLNRPDDQLIEQSATALLARVFSQLLTIKSGPRIAVARVGESHALSGLLTCFELQGLECRSLELGRLEPLQLPLAAQRLKCDALVVQLGGGLTQSWFAERAQCWPEHSFFIGELGRMYADQGCLSRPHGITVSEIARKYDATFGVV
ncbi:MerR family transcriptional regulator [Oceanimonas doudoroffii]|uniref:Helix-turn-helix-type transcriptional regulator n=1 Tax=Oceanimonas doudoroffii TaxID=84158 RepID=A0A233REZ6_9GAMM|nr:MerR family transcriptional regulator [Oceanimonas doudoroffii]OXY81964.1 helix-turn-helix-type transcriptional regulator [Oceanimonas doudoroffii]